MKSKVTIIALIALLFAGMNAIEHAAVQSRPIQPVDNVSAVYKLVGEFRTVFANLLWIKADAYHHEYIQRDKHWCNNKELLGMFKMIIALDPRFVEAYSTGTYIILYGYHNTPGAMQFLQQGLAANPESKDLNQLAAIMYAWKLKNPERALPYAKKAVYFSKDKFERRVAIRMVHSIKRMIRDKQASPA